jgi:formate/nitrite transporter FocA (FNT family)
MSPSTAEETAPLADLSKRANASLRVRSSAIVCGVCVCVAVLCCGSCSYLSSGVCVMLCCVVLCWPFPIS